MTHRDKPAMDLPTANRRLAEGCDLSRQEMQAVMRLIMNGEATAAQLGAFFGGLDDQRRERR